LAPIVIREAASEQVRSWFAEDPAVVTWGWTRVELVGAVERRAREGALTRLQRREALGRIFELAESWDEVTDVVTVRSRAILLLARHRLRAADAGQLAAAALVAEEAFPGLGFICLDSRLAEAAELEGLTVPPF
jgi:predicted nucleic acid-binding protein